MIESFGEPNPECFYYEYNNFTYPLRTIIEHASFFTHSFYPWFNVLIKIKNIPSFPCFDFKNYWNMWKKIAKQPIIYSFKATLDFTEPYFIHCSKYGVFEVGGKLGVFTVNLGSYS